MGIMTNWKTSLAGVGAILTVAGPMVSALASGDLNTVYHDLPVLLAGLTGLFAQDSKS